MMALLDIEHPLAVEEIHIIKALCLDTLLLKTLSLSLLPGGMRLWGWMHCQAKAAG